MLEWSLLNLSGTALLAYRLRPRVCLHIDVSRLTADVPFTGWRWTVGKPEVMQFPITVVKRIIKGWPLFV